jgi:GNAT superfamily N-acetyltransferase
MEHSYTLKDGTELIIRDLTIDDLQLSYDFFISIPEEKRKYFRSDVTRKGHLEKRIKDADLGSIIRRVALYNGKIIGDSSLEIATSDWKVGEAQLRLVISPKHIGKGIQYALAKDLYNIAHERHLNKIITKFMRPQKDLMKIYEKLGFKTEGILPDYVVDQIGDEQDLVFMIATLEDMRKAYDFIGDWIHGDHTTIGVGEM